MAITQREKDRAIKDDIAIKARIDYIKTDKFIEDTKDKIQAFLDSPYLGTSMFQHLSKIKDKLVNDKESYRASALAMAEESKANNDIKLSSEVLPVGVKPWQI